MRNIRSLNAATVLIALWSSAAFSVGATSGYIPHATQRLTQGEREAVFKSIDGADCIYTSLADPLLMMNFQPEIFDLPDQCGSNKPLKDKPSPAQKSACVGTVVCRSAVLTFVVEKAMCWSRDGLHCPPPGKCAEQSFLNAKQFYQGDFGKIPTYINSEPVKATK